MFYKAKTKEAVSLSTKLTRLQLIPSTIVLLAATLAFMVNDLLMFKGAVERNMESTAQVLGQNLTSTLTFLDQAEANKILSSLGSVPFIAEGKVFDKKGEIFAAFKSVNPLGTSPEVGPHEKIKWRGRYLEGYYDLTDAKEVQGVLYLKADLLAFSSEYFYLGLVVALIFLMSIFVSVILAHILKEPLCRPISQLANTSKRVSDTGDYSIRVQSGEMSEVSEIRILSIEFNKMLDQIQSQSEKILKEKEVAEQANQTKSVFLANMSHELRTPLHGILSFARFGIQKFDRSTPEKLKFYFKEIHESAIRLMTLINDLLDLAKLESGKMVYSMRQGNLVETAKSVESELSAFAEERKTKLIVESSETEISLVFDEVRIKQVLLNLLSNAIKFSFPESLIRIVLSSSPHNVICQVVNCGMGIPESELEAVFDKFVQSSKTRTGAGGTGLGLSICKEIVAAHGGRIWAESKLNEETRFIIDLPRNLPELSADPSLIQGTSLQG